MFITACVCVSVCIKVSLIKSQRTAGRRRRPRAPSRVAVHTRVPAPRAAGAGRRALRAHTPDGDASNPLYIFGGRFYLFTALECVSRRVA